MTTNEGTTGKLLEEIEKDQIQNELDLFAVKEVGTAEKWNRRSGTVIEIASKFQGSSKIETRDEFLQRQRELTERNRFITKAIPQYNFAKQTFKDEKNEVFQELYLSQSLEQKGPNCDLTQETESNNTMSKADIVIDWKGVFNEVVKEHQLLMTDKIFLKDKLLQESSELENLQSCRISYSNNQSDEEHEAEAALSEEEVVNASSGGNNEGQKSALQRSSSDSSLALELSYIEDKELTEKIRSEASSIPSIDLLRELEEKIESPLSINFLNGANDLRQSSFPSLMVIKDSIWSMILSSVMLLLWQTLSFLDLGMSLPRLPSRLSSFSLTIDATSFEIQVESISFLERCGVNALLNGVFLVPVLYLYLYLYHQISRQSFPFLREDNNSFSCKDLFLIRRFIQCFFLALFALALISLRHYGYYWKDWPYFSSSLLSLVKEVLPLALLYSWTFFLSRDLFDWLIAASYTSSSFSSSSLSGSEERAETRLREEIFLWNLILLLTEESVYRSVDVLSC